MFKRKTVFSLIALIITALILQACGSSENTSTSEENSSSSENTSSGEPKYGGTLNIMDISHPDSLDPHKEASLRAHNIVGMVYNKLVTFQTGKEHVNDFTVVPDLAKDWEISEDGLKYTFYLRDDVKWQNIEPVNGRPFVADDVVATMERIMEIGHQKFTLESVEKVEAIDDHTVVFTLFEPNAAFLNYLANHFMWILPKEATEGKIDLENTAIGTGPFILESFKRDVEAVLVKNPDYFIEGKPYLDKIVAKVITDSSTRMAAYRSGQADVINQLSPEEIKQLERQFDDQVKFAPLFYTNTRVFLNQAVKPFDDIRVRKAISLAIDRKGIQEKIWDGGVIAGPIGSHLADWALPEEEREELQPYDIEEAKRLLAEAGYPDGFKTTIMTTEGYGMQWVRTAEWVQEDLRKIGIEADLEIVEYGAWISDRWPNSKFEMGVSPQFTQLEPDEYFKRYKSDSPLNWFNINDPELDKMIEDQKRTLDREERVKKVHEIQRYILKELVNPIEISTPFQPYIHRGYVKNYYPHASYGNLHMQNVWLDK